MVNNIIRSAILGVIVLGSTPALADISWNYAQVGFERTEIDVGGGDVDGNGFRLEGSYGFNDNLFVFGSYTTSDIDVGVVDVDFDVFAAGIGIHTNTSSTTQFFGQIGLVDFDSVGGSEDGILAAFGVRNEFSTQFEGKAALEYVDPLEDSEIGLLLEGLYEFNDQLGATVDLRFADDISRIGISLRLTF